MRRLASLAACIAAASAIPHAARAQDPTRTVITRPQIEAAGWFTIGQVLTGAAGWQRSTLDDVSFFVSADGLPAGAAAPSEPEWIVLVDGQRVAADVLGAKLLELLPLSPAQVDSITVTRVPRLAAGTIVGRGIVEFHTRRPLRGGAVAGAWHSGNVTGDPGPYAFTPLAAPNVDRLGPYNHAFASLAGHGWDVGFGAHQGSSHITHRGIRERFDPALYAQLGERAWAPYDAIHARVGGQRFGGRHDLIAGRGWVTGPQFLPLAGREQWLRGRLEHIGASGTVDAGATTLGYQLVRSTLDVGELQSPFSFVAGHARRRTAALIELGVSETRRTDASLVDGRHARLGVGATRWHLERAGATADRTDATVFIDFTVAAGRFRHELSSALGRSSGGPVVGKGVLASRVATDSLTTFSVAVSVIQHASGDDGTWIERSLLGLDTLTRERDARASVDVAAARRIADRWTVDAGLRVGAVTGVRLLSDVGLPLGDRADGGVGELRAGLARQVTPRVPVARATYRFAKSLGGDVSLRDALRATPLHALEGYLVTAVAPDFRLGGSLYLTSSTRWSALRGGPATPITLPAIARVDLSAEKWFWRHHVRTQILVRNLLNGAERYHPLGADFPLRAHLTVALAVPAAP